MELVDCPELQTLVFPIRDGYQVYDHCPVALDSRSKQRAVKYDNFVLLLIDDVFVIASILDNRVPHKLLDHDNELVGLCEIIRMKILQLQHFHQKDSFL